MIIIYIQAAFVLINIILAWYHAKLIKEQKKIRHGLWAGAVIILIAIVCIATANWFHGPPLLFLRALIFSPALNLFRRLPIAYTSPTSTSILDKAENQIFGKNWNAKIATYVICFVVTEVILIFSYA